MTVIEEFRRSGRTWRRALKVAAWTLASILAALVGPFGTFEAMNFEERLFYWSGLIGVSLLLALGIRKVTLSFLDDTLSSDLAGSVAIALTLGPAICVFNVMVLGHDQPAGIGAVGRQDDTRGVDQEARPRHPRAPQRRAAPWGGNGPRPRPARAGSAMWRKVSGPSVTPARCCRPAPVAAARVVVAGDPVPGPGRPSAAPAAAARASRQRSPPRRRRPRPPPASSRSRPAPRSGCARVRGTAARPAA
jgi:hypothetical protein